MPNEILCRCEFFQKTTVTLYKDIAAATERKHSDERNNPLQSKHG